MRPASTRNLFLLLALALLTPVAALAQQSSSAYGPLPVFEFHSGFWINLHHMLYYEAKLRDARPAAAQRGSPAPLIKLNTMKEAATALSPAERLAWDSSVDYYVANYVNKDLLFNNDLILLKNQLGDFEDCDELSGTRKKTCDAGLPPKLTRVLEAAAPVYRAHLWAEQDRANRRWVARVAPLVEEQGVGISERLADIYQAKWPRDKIRVDVAAYANAAGAYTTLDPLRVTISSLDPRNQGDEAFEVLFHEASHGIAEPVESAIIRECHQRDKAIPRDLWHALIFYTTGEVIRPILNTPDNAPPAVEDAVKPNISPPPSRRETYTPYAIREGLYERGWKDYLQLLTRFWQPYLDNKSTFDDAIARMVSAL
ncbi:MAG TPA: hypothetical protein VJW94_14205 [Candidatus Acidoferrum sp.]|nr:hypothetical protein [Candidatus Acidoferrum sp.]